MDLPENPYLSPHMHCLHVVYGGLLSNNNYGRFTCITMYHMVSPSFQWSDFPEILCLESNEISEYPKIGIVVVGL
jgi:hypothetical protein